MTVKLDLKQGSNVVDTSNGTTATRTGIISGLTGSKEQMLAQARTVPGLPQIGESHPSIPNLILTSRNIDALGAGKASVVLTYSIPTYDQRPPDPSAPGTIEIGGGSQTIETNFDKDGNELRIQIEKTQTDENGNQIIVEDSQLATVSIETPVTSLLQQRTENGPATLNAYQFRNKVNSGSVWGFAERTLLCWRIDSQQITGNLYNVTYEFLYKPDTWDVTAVYIDEDTGQPHKDVDKRSGNGILRARVYPEADFRRLNLSF